jgi:hypothetical protein
VIMLSKWVGSAGEAAILPQSSASYAAPRRRVSKPPGEVTIGLAAYDRTVSHARQTQLRWRCKSPRVDVRDEAACGGAVRQKSTAPPMF